ncbi:hypothetical protein Tco_1362942 [Tanacetum coccineum]
MYHNLYLGGKALVERDNVGFDSTKSNLCPSFVEDLTAKGVGLRVADSHTGNHRDDDFMALETIQRFLGIIGSRSLSSSKGRPSSQMGGLRLVQALKKEEFFDFLFFYLVPSEYKVMLPKRNQTIFNAPDGYVDSLVQTQPFGCAKLTTFAIMCKVYGCEPTVDQFRGFFNLFPGGQWLTFAKRPEKHIPNLLPKALIDEDVKGFGEFSLEVMDDERVSLVDGVFDGALSDESWCFGEGVLVSSLVRSMNTCLGGMMVIFGLLKVLEVEALVDVMEVMVVDDK